MGGAGGISHLPLKPPPRRPPQPRNKQGLVRWLAFPFRSPGGRKQVVKRKPAASGPGSFRTPASRYATSAVARKPAAFTTLSLKRKPAATLGKCARAKGRLSGEEYFAHRRPGPRLKPVGQLSESGRKTRQRMGKQVKRIIIGTGWGRCGTMNFAANCGKQGYYVTHEVGCVYE